MRLLFTRHYAARGVGSPVSQRLTALFDKRTMGYGRQGGVSSPPSPVILNEVKNLLGCIATLPYAALLPDASLVKGRWRAAPVGFRRAQGLSRFNGEKQ